jgi:hypothetical protein
MGETCARCGKTLKKKGFICTECEAEYGTLFKAMEHIRRVKEWLRARIAKLATLITPDKRKEPT